MRGSKGTFESEHGGRLLSDELGEANNQWRIFKDG